MTPGARARTGIGARTPRGLAKRALLMGTAQTDLVTFVLEEETADSIDGLAETLARLWINALKIP